MSGRFLALDAGNSKTVALVTDATGAVLGRARGGRGDIYNAASPDAAAEAVIGTAGRALAEAGVAAAQIRAAAFRIAGVDWPEDETWWRERIHSTLPGLQSVDVANDGVASLRLGSLDGVGLAITAGTGPAIAARNRDGMQAWSGWWVFDNLGGWGLAEESINAVCLAWMGLGEATALVEPMLALFDVPDPRELRHSLTRRFRTRPADDELRATRLVLQVAATGDPVALGLVRRQAAAFARYGEWVAGQVSATPGPGFPIVLNGSVITSEHSSFRDELIAALLRRFPAASVRVGAAAPLAGCVLDALALGGVRLTDSLRDRVAQTPQPPGFLGT
jgi:Predicted N-acetylglucosamine kinase